MKLGYGQDMSLKHTPAGNLESIAPNFKLIGTDGKYYSLSGCKGEKGTLVMFICNHCPYVIAVRERLVEVANKLIPYGVNSVAIMANDPTDYPEDSFENMKKVAAKFNFSFPYLLDESQEIAKTYGAVCTPDFFGYNQNLKLQYRGRLDEGHMEPHEHAVVVVEVPRRLGVSVPAGAAAGGAPSWLALPCGYGGAIE